VPEDLGGDGEVEGDDPVEGEDDDAVHDGDHTWRDPYDMWRSCHW
jgi:hypothetical protein